VVRQRIGRLLYFFLIQIKAYRSRLPANCPPTIESEKAVLGTYAALAVIGERLRIGTAFKVFLASLRKRTLLVEILSSSEQNAE